MLETRRVVTGGTQSFRTTDDVLLDLGAGFISVLTE